MRSLHVGGRGANGVGSDLMQQLTDRKAAGLLLRTLLNEAAGPEVRSLVMTGLEPRDMFQVEYMMILAAAQSLQRAGKPIDLAALESELEPGDPAAFARIVLRSVHEDRHAGPTSVDEVRDLVSFLLQFRGQK